MGTKNDPGKYDCHGKAAPDEPIFTLRAKDMLAPFVVRQWALAYHEYHKRGIISSKKFEQEKFDEAMACADAMEEWRKKHG